MERNNKETIARLEEKLNIPWMANLPTKSFSSKNHIVWTHPDFDWNPIPYDSNGSPLNLGEEINRIAGDILEKISSLHPHFFDAKMGKKAAMVDNTCGKKYYQLDEQTSFRKEVGEVYDVLKLIAGLYDTTKRVDLFHRLASNKKSKINLGISDHEETKFLSYLTKNFCKNSNITFFLTREQSNGYITPYYSTEAPPTPLEIQYKHFKDITNVNPAVSLLGVYANECVGHTFGELYSIFNEVNVLYDFCSRHPDSNYNVGRYHFPVQIQEMLKTARRVKSDEKKVQVILNSGRHYFSHDNKFYFKPSYLTRYSNHRNLRENIEKINLVSEQEAGRLLGIN